VGAVIAIKGETGWLHRHHQEKPPLPAQMQTTFVLQKIVKPETNLETYHFPKYTKCKIPAIITAQIQVGNNQWEPLVKEGKWLTATPDRYFTYYEAKRLAVTVYGCQDMTVRIVSYQWED
jgi:hypothetical protein